MKYSGDGRDRCSCICPKCIVPLRSSPTSDHNCVRRTCDHGNDTSGCAQPSSHCPGVFFSFLAVFADARPRANHPIKIRAKFARRRSRFCVKNTRVYNALRHVIRAVSVTRRDDMISQRSATARCACVYEGTGALGPRCGNCSPTCARGSRYLPACAMSMLVLVLRVGTVFVTFRSTKMPFLDFSILFLQMRL